LAVIEDDHMKVETYVVC